MGGKYYPVLLASSQLLCLILNMAPVVDTCTVGQSNEPRQSIFLQTWESLKFAEKYTKLRKEKGASNDPNRGKMSTFTQTIHRSCEQQ